MKVKKLNVLIDHLSLERKVVAACEGSCRAGRESSGLTCPSLPVLAVKLASAGSFVFQGFYVICKAGMAARST